MKIAILLAYEKSPYAGVVRPFINWAKEFSRRNLDAEFLLVKVGRKIPETLSKLNFKFYDFHSLKDLFSFYREGAYEYILADDYIKRLKILEKIKGEFGRVVYAQVLYGIHTISEVHKPLSVKEKIIFSIARNIPFSFLKRRYVSLLKKIDVIVANSQATANILHVLYGVEPDGVVYPPVDTEVFSPKKLGKNNQILIYLGSHAGDTGKLFANKILEILKNKNFEVLIMGNKILGKKLKMEFDTKQVSGVSDKELAEIYSECKLVVCPQKWEQFGYVVAESIACGTPVLAFNCLGPAEIVMQTGFGLLANNEKEFLRILENIDKYLKNLNFNREAEFPFTSETSTKKLIEITSKNIKPM